MAISPQRQFHSTCILVQHQLHRVGESFDLDECYQRAQQRNMLHDYEADFIRACLVLDEAGDADKGPEGLSLEETIKKLQYLVSSRMNLGDCA